MWKRCRYIITFWVILSFLSQNFSIADNFGSSQKLSARSFAKTAEERRAVLAELYGRLIWVARSDKYKGLLNRYNANAILLPSGRYLISEEIENNNLGLIRAIVHEDYEILMQCEEEEHPVRYNRLMKRVLNDAPIMNLYRVLSHYKEGQPDNITFNDLIAKAFELMFIIEKDLVDPDRELRVDEREFLGLMRPVLNDGNFSRVFFDAGKRTRVVMKLQKDKRERFYRAASDNTEPSEERNILIEKLNSAGIRRLFLPLTEELIEILIQYLKEGLRHGQIEIMGLVSETVVLDSIKDGKISFRTSKGIQTKKVAEVFKSRSFFRIPVEIAPIEELRRKTDILFRPAPEPVVKKSSPTQAPVKKKREKKKTKKEEEFERLIDRASDLEALFSSDSYELWSREVDDVPYTHTEQLESRVKETLIESLAYLKLLDLRLGSGRLTCSFRHRQTGRYLNVKENIEKGLPKVEVPVIPEEHASVLRSRLKNFNKAIDLNFQALRSLESESIYTPEGLSQTLFLTRRMAEELIRMKMGSEDWTLDRGKSSLPSGIIGIFDVTERVSCRIQDKILSRDFYKVTGKQFKRLVKELPPREVKGQNDVISLHSLILFLHQEAIRGMIELIKEARGHSSEITMGKANIDIVDLTEKRTGVAGEERVNRALEPLWWAMNPVGLGQGSISLQEKALIVLYGDDLWIHLPIFEHIARLHVNFSPMRGKGQIRLDYQEGSYAEKNILRLNFFKEILESIGFRCSVQKRNLEAVLTKEEIRLPLETMGHELAVVIRMLIQSCNLDVSIRTSENLSVDAFLWEESIRYFHSDITDVSRNLFLPEYLRLVNDERNEKTKQLLRRELNEILKHNGLTTIPDNLPMTQITVDRYFNLPILRGLKSGWLDLATLVEPDTDTDISLIMQEFSENFLTAVKKDGVKAVQMGQMASALNAYIEYHPVMIIGPCILEEGFIRPISGREVVIKRLRHIQTNEVLYAIAHPALHIESDEKTIQPAISPMDLRHLVKPLGWHLPLPQPVSKTRLDKQWKRLSEPPIPRSLNIGHINIVSRTEEEIVRGSVFYKGQSGIIESDSILLAPFTGAGDIPVMEKARGIVTTNPNELTHSAIVSRELGIPSVSVHGRWNKGRLEVARYRYDQENTTSIRHGFVIPIAWGVHEEWVPCQPGTQLLLDQDTQLYYLLPNNPLAKQVWQVLTTWQPGIKLDKTLLSEALKNEELWSMVFFLTYFDIIHNEIKPRLLELLAEHPERLHECESWFESGVLNRMFEKLKLMGERLGLTRFTKEVTPEFISFLRMTERTYCMSDISILEDDLTSSVHQYGSSTVLRLLEKWSGEEVKDTPVKRPLHISEEEVPFILSSSQVAQIGEEWSGGKGASLAELEQISVDGEPIKTAPYFIITIRALREFLKTTLLNPALAESLDLEDLSGRPLGDALTEILRNPVYGESGAERFNLARSVLEKSPFPEDSQLGRLILESYDMVIGQGMAAARSSRRGEDAEKKSHAGLYETVLGAPKSRILESIKHVWASQLNEHILSYLGSEPLSEEAFNQMAVIVQKAVPSEVSGVLFTRNPAQTGTGALIRATYGLGIRVVDGTGPTDRYLIDLETGNLIEQPDIAQKDTGLYLSVDGGTEERSIPIDLQYKECLDDGKLKRLAAAGKAIRERYGMDMDIEFAFAGDELFILQARPITRRRPAVIEIPDLKYRKPFPPEKIEPLLRRIELYPSFHNFTEPLRSAAWTTVNGLRQRTGNVFAVSENEIILDEDWAAGIPEKGDTTGYLEGVLRIAASYYASISGLESKWTAILTNSLIKKFVLYENIRNSNLSRPLRILCVCIGNTHRSPSLQALIQKLADQAGLGSLIKIKSCGIMAEDGSQIKDNELLESSRSFGIYEALVRHRRKQLSISDLEDADIIIAADETVIHDISKMSQDASSKTLLWGESTGLVPAIFYGGLPDPIGSSAILYGGLPNPTGSKGDIESMMKLTENEIKRNLLPDLGCILLPKAGPIGSAEEINGKEARQLRSSA